MAFKMAGFTAFTKQTDGPEDVTKFMSGPTAEKEKIKQDIKDMEAGEFVNKKTKEIEDEKAAKIAENKVAHAQHISGINPNKKGENIEQSRKNYLKTLNK